MVRFIVASLLLAVALLSSVEGRSAAGDVVLRPINGTNPINNSISNLWIVARKLLTVGDECQQTCNHVHFRTMCRSLARLPGVTTPRELLVAAMREAIGKANLAKRRVDEYAASYHGGDPMASILDTCSGGYDAVAQGMEEMQQFIDTHPRHGELMSRLSGVTTSASDCDNAFQERPEIRSPFLAAQRNVYRLVDNVLNIADFIKQV